MLKRLFGFVVIMLLTACKDGEDLSSSKNTNYDEQAVCWQAKIIDIVLGQIDNLFKAGSAKVADGGAVIIMLGFSIWMAFRLLKVLPSFKEENLGEVWTEIGHKLFLCAFCAWAVSDGKMISWTLNTFVIPIYNAILELGSAILGNIQSGRSIDLGIFGTVTFNTSYTECRVQELDADSLQSSIQPMASCLVCQVNDRLNAGIRLGIELIALLELDSIFVGITMLLIFTCAKFGFVFFLVDALFRLNFAALLFPLLIMCVPFNYTRKWSKQGFLMFLNSSGIMLFMGTLICIAIGALETTLDNFEAAGAYKNENMSNPGPVMLSLLLISFLLINIPGLGVVMADKFIGGGRGMEFQKQVTKFAMNTAKRAGAAILSAVSGAVTSTITNTMEKYEKSREVLDTVRQAKNKLNSLAGYNKK